MQNLFETLLLICMFAAAMFSMVIIIVLIEIIFYLVTDRIREVYRYVSGKFKDNEKYNME